MSNLPRHGEEACAHALALSGSGDGVWDLDVAGGRVEFSDAARLVLAGFAVPSERVEDWMERIHPEDRAAMQSELAAHIEGRTPRFHNEHRLRVGDGAERWVLARGRCLRDGDGRPRRVVGTLTDTTVRKAAEQLLAHQIAHDPLTGLPNRAAFLDRLERALTRAHRGPEYRFAVIFLDLDRFKLVNDSLGHLTGDQVLVAVSRRLVATVRPSDLVAHLNGDEFAILVDHMRAPLDASVVADRIHQALREPFHAAGAQDVFLTASAGIALSDGGYGEPADMLRDADTAMYRAKTQSGGRTELFDPRMNELALARLRLETDLRLALDRRELRVHYQPIISLRTGQIAAFEALLRWTHPQRGPIGPAEFVPVAEETGLIVPICGWMLGECCAQVRAWHDRVEARRVSVSINLAALNISHPGIVGQVEVALRESGLDGRHLTLEITETVLMSDLAAVAAVLLELKRLGVELHIDDFGTGYSSLSYLHRLPADALKIDRSFVSALGGPEGDPVIVRTIVDLAHNLGRRVVAEGVETAAQLAQLRALGCEYGQGYFFSRPLPPEEAEELLRSAPRW
jgi:diguanylate cyclase (GGDEF)-like protein/PAS domain S-box-containing protein